MEVDVSEPRSRAFNIFLRYFHLGISLLVASLISSLQATNCSTTFLKIGQPISYILLGLNLVFILVLRCRKQFNRKIFFVGLAADIILAGVVMVLGLGGIGQANSCANNKVLSRFSGFLSLVTLILTPMSLLGPFDWSLRYTNAPGNIVWVFMFLGFSWTNTFKGGMITIGLFHIVLTVVTFFVHLLPVFKGLTTQIKNVIRWEWMGGLAVMVLCEIIAMIIYLGGSEASQFQDFVAKKLLQTYFPINIIDGIFWVWGLLTLRYTGGDTVREGIMREGEDSDNNDLDNQQSGMGTIR